MRGGGRVQLPDPEMGADVANGKWREVESIEKVEYQCLDLEICRAEYDGKEDSLRHNSESVSEVV